VDLERAAMQLDDYRESDNIEDRRGAGGAASRGRRTAIRGGVGGIIIGLIAIGLGADPKLVLKALISEGPAGPPPQSRPQGGSGRNDEMKSAVAKFVATTEDCWNEQFKGRYHPPKLVIFEHSVDSACGRAGASVGPFYCGEDQKMYIDLSFYDELREKLGAPGDFAQAYVIAHEVGHHIQNLQGTLDKVHQIQRRVDKRKSNAISVRLELQADFYAGIWGHYVKKKGLLDIGDVEEALQAAASIGDDRLQQMSQGTIVPDSFTHGSSEQRVRWFRKGLESGDIRQGDTFSAEEL